ncbi:MAG: prolyl oligopeptidase family serine peptidase [Ekhidna sp.]|nr:prolyl oligopeptidase family serine peptidase [Ekhidna sp.]MBC6425347.1 prolyl oligopeptidase family serine peptidase [Ekhidna sp.]
MKIIKKTLITLLVIIVIAYIGICYILSNRVLKPDSSFEQTLADMPDRWGTTFEEMMALLPNPEEINIKGFEEITLKGQYFNVSNEDKCLYIFAHGWENTWPNMLKYYPMVEECGCDILMYDHRVHGESGGKYPTGGIKEAEDLLLVTQWAADNKGFDWNQIAWLGSSWGAATALLAGAVDNNPALIVADAPFQDWYSAVFERAIKDYGSGIKAIAPGVMQVVNMRSGVHYKDASPREKAKDITEPVLLIHSEGDLATSSDQSVNISKNLNNRSVFHHTQWGNDHVDDVVKNTEGMKKLLMNFIEKNNIEAFLPILPKTDTDVSSIE